MNRALARSATYNILSLCFTYPDDRVFSWLSQGEWIRGLREAFRLLSEGSFEGFLQSLGDFGGGNKEHISLELAREYTRLFINAFPHVVAAPYGSVYLEKDGLVFGKTTAEVIRFYHESGFTLKEDLTDLPDHIANELEFMAILANQENDASGGEKIRLEEVQMNFLSRFMLPWVPDFCQKVAEASRSPFYRELCNLTMEFIRFEKNYLGVPEETNFHKKLESDTIGG